MAYIRNPQTFTRTIRHSGVEIKLSIKLRWDPMRHRMGERNAFCRVHGEKVKATYTPELGEAYRAPEALEDNDHDLDPDGTYALQQRVQLALLDTSKIKRVTVTPTLGGSNHGKTQENE